QSLALSAELKGSRVVYNEDVVVVRAPLGRHPHVWLQDPSKPYAVVVEEAIERLELSLGRHRLRKAPRRIPGKPLTDGLQTGAAPKVAERSTAILPPDLCKHPCYRSRARRTCKNLCGILSVARRLSSSAGGPLFAQFADRCGAHVGAAGEEG